MRLDHASDPARPAVTGGGARRRGPDVGGVRRSGRVGGSQCALPPGRGHARQPQRKGEGHAPQRRRQILQLLLAGPAAQAPGQVLVDLGRVSGSEPPTHVGAEVVDGEAAGVLDFAPEVGLEETLPEPGPGPHRQLGHAVGRHAEKEGGLAGGNAFHLREPQHRAPALRKAPEGGGHQRGVDAVDQAVGRPHDLGRRLERLRCRRGTRPAGAPGYVEGGVAGGREEVGTEAGAVVQLPRLEYHQHPGEGLGHGVGGVVGVAGDGVGHPPRRGRVTAIELVEGLLVTLCRPLGQNLVIGAGLGSVSASSHRVSSEHDSSPSSRSPALPPLYPRGGPGGGSSRPARPPGRAT